MVTMGSPGAHIAIGAGLMPKLELMLRKMPDVGETGAPLLARTAVPVSCSCHFTPPGG